MCSEGQTQTDSTTPLDREAAVKGLDCPSAQADWEGARAFGVVVGPAAKPRVAYLPKPLAVDSIAAGLPADVAPAEVFRIAAPCANLRCQHFGGGKCQLAARTVAILEPVVEKLPPCIIRTSCRWWREQGREACYRCPQVITNSSSENESYIRAATPA